MDLPITWDKLNAFAASATELREKAFRQCVLDGLCSPEYVVKKLELEIIASADKKDGNRHFRIVAGIFSYIYRRFGDRKQVEKELWVVLADFLKNFPTTNRLLEVVDDGDGTPVSCRLILCFNLIQSPSNQTNSHPPPA